MGHSGVNETSWALYLFPSLVDLGQGYIAATIASISPRANASAGGRRRPRCNYGINYRAAIKLDLGTSPGLWANGVKFATGRQVFDAGGNRIELECDACGVSFEPNDSWSAVGAWLSGDALVSFPCPSCVQHALLTQWRCPWPWGFGRLGIEFSNWPPLSDEFIHAITRKLGHRTVMVRLHM
jgi:hypothetical protein